MLQSYTLTVGSLELRFEHATLSSHSAPPPERYKALQVHIMCKQVTRYEPPRLLSWNWDGDSEVAFEPTPQGDEVLLVVMHRRPAGRAAMAEVGAGWHTHLAVLTDRLNAREPEAFWSIFVETDEEYEKRFAEA